MEETQEAVLKFIVAGMEAQLHLQSNEVPYPITHNIV